MNTPVSRKSFLTSLGAAGVGAGLLRFAPPAFAQDTDDDGGDDPASAMEPGEWEDKRIEMYAAFTEALATELGDTTADDVDGAIRKAIMSLIDDHVSEDELTRGQAEALKVIVATMDVPIMPGFMGMGMGPGPGMGMGMMHGGMMHGGMMPGGMMPGGMGSGDMMHGDMMPGGMGSGRDRVRIRERQDKGHWGGKDRDKGKDKDWSMAPDAPPAPDQAAPAAPAAASTPEAGA